MWTSGFYHRVRSPKAADGMADSVDSDQIAEAVCLIWVNTLLFEVLGTLGSCFSTVMVIYFICWKNNIIYPSTINFPTQKQKNLYHATHIFRFHITVLVTPPAKCSFRGYTVFSMSVIPSSCPSVNLSFRQHLRVLLYNFASFCPILFRFTSHHYHQTMHVC